MPGSKNSTSRWLSVKHLSFGIALLSGTAAGATGQACAEEMAVSGRIEAYETSVGVSVPARVKLVSVREGDTVRKGQLILQLDDQEIQARIKGINIIIAAAQHQQTQAKDWLHVLKRELERATAHPVALPSRLADQKAPVLAKTELKASMLTSANSGDKPRVLAVSSQSEVSPVEEDSLGAISLNAQLNALDEGLKFEQSTIDEAYNAQCKALNDGFQAKQSALDDGIKTKMSALEEGYKIKTSSFKGGLFSSLSGANKAKHIAADEIYKAKKAALEDALKTRQAALDEAKKADQAALEQAVKAKRQAVDETFKSKRQALAQVAETEAVMERTIKNTQASFKTELGKLQSGLSQKLSSGPASSISETLKAAQLSNLRLQLSQVEESIAVAATEVAKAQAAREEVNARATYFKVYSPTNGTCARSNINTGEVAVPGQSLMTLIDLNNVYMRAFIPEGNIGKVKIGQSAEVFLDSAPKTPLSARVVAIDPQASFTPENVYFKDDRVRQVFGIKIKIENPDGMAKPGMPADGKIRLGDASK